MLALDLDAAFALAMSGRLLLEHPYYQEWQEGLLAIGDLGAYAAQYRHVERCLPGVLAATAESLEEGVPRRLVEENLSDEQSRPRPHAELFEGFATAVGADKHHEATTATRELVELYARATSWGPIAALSVIGAYELQAAQVAATKADSLRVHYGLGDLGTEFWDVHADLEQVHGRWTVEALRILGAPPSTVQEFAKASANAWWAFLDERNMARLN
ncbi:MAG: iron-containing redox enzyme family protein [Acidimicrobiales bacterium]